MIDTSKLTAYTEEHRLPLLRNAVIGGKSAKLFNLQTGVLDAILPNMAPLALTLFIFYLCKKGVKTSYITFGLMIAGFVLGILGIIG